MATEETIKFLTSGLERFKLETTKLEEGSPANLSLFLPDVKYTFGKNDILSTSKNSIFLDSQLKGKAVGVVNNAGLIFRS